MSNLGKWLGAMKVQFDKHSPAILTGLGITGMVVSVIFSVKATPKAVASIEKKKKELGKENLTIGETIKATWKHYIPTAVTIVGSAACVLGVQSVNARRSAALAAAYSLSETALQEYQDKVKNVIGERKENDIRSGIERDKIAADPPRAERIVIVGRGDQLFKESISGREFYSTRSAVERAELALCQLMRDRSGSMFDDDDGFISVNDVYVALGLKTTDESEDDRGWYMKNGYIKFIYDPIILDSGDVCTVIRYSDRPVSSTHHKYFA